MNLTLTFRHSVWRWTYHYPTIYFYTFVALFFPFLTYCATWCQNKDCKKAFLCFLNCIFNNLFHAWSTPNQLLVWFVYQFSNNCVFNALHNVLKRIKMCWFREVCNKPIIDIMQWEKGRSSVDTKLQITIKFDKIWAAFYAISRQYKNSTFVWLF